MSTPDAKYADAVRDQHEWHMAWTHIAESCDDALACIGETHPRRALLLEVRREAYRAAAQAAD
jgi:hypothetical protein